MCVWKCRCVAEWFSTLFAVDVLAFSNHWNPMSRSSGVSALTMVQSHNTSSCSQVNVILELPKTKSKNSRRSFICCKWVNLPITKLLISICVLAFATAVWTVSLYRWRSLKKSESMPNCFSIWPMRLTTDSLSSFLGKVPSMRKREKKQRKECKVRESQSKRRKQKQFEISLQNAPKIFVNKCNVWVIDFPSLRFWRHKEINRFLSRLLRVSMSRVH